MRLCSTCEPRPNRSFALQHFEHGNTIEICNGIMFDDYHIHVIFGASLSELHTSVTASLDACVCMFACGHIPKIQIERTDFKFAHVLKQIHVR